MYVIDINCDMGEGRGPNNGIDQDAELMDFVSSVNIACGFHAGDHHIMFQTVRHAAQKGVAIGAHPGLPDRAGFGRTPMLITAQEAYELTTYQLGALSAFTHAEGVSLHHVKPHGALYNMAAEDLDLARAIAQAVFDFDPDLLLYGLSGSQLITAAQQLGLRAVNEVFADRNYQADGTLAPRSQPNSVIQDPQEMLSHSKRLVIDQMVTALDGSEVPIVADTICLHGDGEHALDYAKLLVDFFKDSTIEVKAKNHGRNL